ncbi:MAG: hypothetical protein K2X93_12765 [Candidatus Obscuribacterales bacterium]|nr:hypothetical protein [Candidatus Obscuribacterales bacterium]
MTDVAEILHNIADHTETFHRFLSETGLNSELKSRLIDHIILEERENTAKLHQLHGTNPSALTQKLLDHSYILQKIMGEGTMPTDLKQELLHHFIEEHEEWQKDLLGTPSGHVEAGSPPPAKGTEHGAGAHQHQGHGGQGHHGAQQQHGHAARGSELSHGGHSHGQGAKQQRSHEAHGQKQSHGGHSHGAQSHKSQESHQSHSAHHGSGYQKSSTDSPSNEPETRGWTVGPMWNQGG